MDRQPVDADAGTTSLGGRRVASTGRPRHLLVAVANKISRCAELLPFIEPVDDIAQLRIFLGVEFLGDTKAGETAIVVRL